MFTGLTQSGRQLHLCHGAFNSLAALAMIALTIPIPNGFADQPPKIQG